MSDIFEEILCNAKKETDKVSKKTPEVIESKTNKWNHIPGSLRYSHKPVEEWSTKDLVCYFQEVFKGEFGKYLEISLAYECQSFLLLQDSIKKVIGERQPKKFVKDYIDWFIEKKARKIILRYKCFKTKYMRSPWNIEEFYDQYKMPKNIDTTYVENLEHEYTDEKSLISVYSSSTAKFITKYGLIITAVWMQKKSNLSQDEVIKKITDQVSKTIKNNKLKYKDIIDSTERYSPYPSWCEIDYFDKIINNLSERTGYFFDIIDIEFSDEANTFHYLKNPKK